MNELVSLETVKLLKYDDWVGRVDFYYINYWSDFKKRPQYETGWKLIGANRIEGIGGRLHRSFEHYPAPYLNTFLK